MEEFGFRALLLNFILIFVLYLELINGYTSNFNKRIILNEVNSYCDLYCYNTKMTSYDTHTLCNASETRVSNTCKKNFYEYDLDLRSMKTDLLDGHNGLRNRIAGRMNVSDMRKLTWDTELSRMASVWITSCKGLQEDPCANNIVFYRENEKIKNAQGGLVINQLRTAKRSKFLPPEFISIVLQGWYLEKNLMKPPRIRKNYGSFQVSNNFTQLAWASTYRIGCAVARDGEFYILICNYFPYRNISSNEYAFSYGKPVSLCPNMAPLQDVKFENLCTGDDRGHRIEVNLAVIIIFVSIIVLNELKHFF